MPPAQPPDHNIYPTRAAHTIGVDPGRQGGIFGVDGSGALVFAYAFPDTWDPQGPPRALIMGAGRPATTVAVEDPPFFVSNTPTPQLASSMGKLQRDVGRWEGIARTLVHLGMVRTVHMVKPTQWQRPFGVFRGNKEGLRRTFLLSFPELENKPKGWQLAVADAALIALYTLTHL